MLTAALIQIDTNSLVMLLWIAIFALIIVNLMVIGNVEKGSLRVAVHLILMACIVFGYFNARDIERCAKGANAGATCPFITFEVKVSK